MLANRLFSTTKNAILLGQQEYTTSGTYTFTAPSNTTSLRVTLVAGGGPGGIDVVDESGGSGGGGAGGKARVTIAAIAGESFRVIVGSGGIGVAQESGTTSEVFALSGTNRAIAVEGGGPGFLPFDGAAGPGGIGGSSPLVATNVTVLNAETGEGGQGGGAFFLTDGGSGGSTSFFGITGTGGPGGDSNSDGQPATGYGAGGGGCGGLFAGNGGNGSKGYVKIEYFA